MDFCESVRDMQWAFRVRLWCILQSEGPGESVSHRQSNYTVCIRTQNGCSCFMDPPLLLRLLTHWISPATADLAQILQRFNKLYIHHKLNSVNIFSQPTSTSINLEILGTSDFTTQQLATLGKYLHFSEKWEVKCGEKCIHEWELREWRNSQMVSLRFEKLSGELELFIDLLCRVQHTFSFSLTNTLAELLIMESEQ